VQKLSFPVKHNKNYVLHQVEVSVHEMLASKENFINIVDFCLHTRKIPKNNELQKAIKYFNEKYEDFRENIYEGNLSYLRDIIEKAPGVGQKIGALILEIFIFYGKNNTELIKELYVPLDAHTTRLFKEALNLKNVPEKYPISRKRLEAFQTELTQYVPDGGERIVFDFLWFIGKVYCQKITRNDNGYSRGFRLCSECWIRKYCQIKDQWDLTN
jgi:endonuclease III